MAREIRERLVVRGALEALTPLHVGGIGSDADSDLPLARNGRGLFYVPGTSLAGPLRSWCEAAFGEKDGLRSCLFSGNVNIELVKKYAPQALAREEEAALIYLNEMRRRPEFAFPVLLLPGEMVFINNYELLHGREDFEDGDTPEEKRFLLRLWLQGRPGRPKPEGMMVVKNRSGLQGVDPKPNARAHA